MVTNAQLMRPQGGVKMLGKVRLKTGEEMAMKRVECPAGDYAERLTQFLEHKRDRTFRDMKQRLRGDYAADSLDRFFVGEIEGRIVSQMGYMLPRDTMDVGVFGHVYTQREQRGKGAASALMAACMADFNAGAGQALFCGTGSPVAQRLYAKHGFAPLDAQLAPLGPQAYIKPPFAKDFTDLQRMFFAPGRAVHVRNAHMGDRPKVDKVLHQSDGIRGMRESWLPVFLAAPFTDFVAIHQAVEDDKGMFTVLETADKHVVGYAFALSFGSPIERESKVLDFLVHPSYHHESAVLVEATARKALSAGAQSVRCYLPSCGKFRADVLKQAGFKHEHTFADYCQIGDMRADLRIFLFDRGMHPSWRRLSSVGKHITRGRRADCV